MLGVLRLRRERRGVRRGGLSSGRPLAVRAEDGRLRRKQRRAVNVRTECFNARRRVHVHRRGRQKDFKVRRRVHDGMRVVRRAP